MLGVLAALASGSPISLLPPSFGLFSTHEDEGMLLRLIGLEDSLALPPSQQGLFWLLAGGGVPQSQATPSLPPRNLLAASGLPGTAFPPGRHHKMLPLGRGLLDPCPLGPSWQWLGTWVWVSVCVCMGSLCLWLRGCGSQALNWKVGAVCLCKCQ